MEELPRYSVLDHGALGNGVDNDAAAIQRAIDAAAAAGGGVVVLPGPRAYRSGTVTLRSHVHLRIEAGATLLASNVEGYYRDGVLLAAQDAEDLSITGQGTIAADFRRFMAADLGPIYQPGPFRPALLRWVGCREVTIRGVRFEGAPHWCLHLAGCAQVLIEAVTIAGDLKVPNADGIDIDHCRDVLIRRCTIRTGDDAIVLKTTRKFARYGPCERIRVSDCTLKSTSCALKIGTETVNDIRDVRFERCTIEPSHRALGIMLRDEGNVEDVVFAQMTVQTELFDKAWWGRAEPIYVTALPRSAGGRLGRLRRVVFEDVRCAGPNGAYLAGCAESPLQDVALSRVTLTLDEQVDRRGSEYDRRPTTGPAYVTHPVAGIRVEGVDGLVVRDLRLEWRKGPGEHQITPVAAERVQRLVTERVSAGPAPHTAR